jgi:hypothetical protein
VPSLDLSPATLFAGLVVSSIGFGLFRYGKKCGRPPQLLAGIALMAYPGFVTGPMPVFAIAGGLLAVLWVSLRLGC